MSELGLISQVSDLQYRLSLLVTYFEKGRKEDGRLFADINEEFIRETREMLDKSYGRNLSPNDMG